jgi:flagellar biosynthesis/type III secretory pathway chaperone
MSLPGSNATWDNIVLQVVRFLDDSVVTELIDVLQLEKKVYADLLDISKNKTNIIIEGKAAELDKIIKSEQSLVLVSSRLENAREGFMAKLSEQIGLKPGEITITNLLPHVRASRKIELELYRQQINAVINELKKVNDLNAGLIRNSLEYINFSINLISGGSAGNISYSNTGKITNGNKHSLFDIKL